jgi:methyl-accepting chemotaxis protein
MRLSSGSTITTKLLIGFLLVGAIPLGTIANLAWRSLEQTSRQTRRAAAQAFKAESFARLAAIRDVAGRQLENYFVGCRIDLAMLAMDTRSRPNGDVGPNDRKYFEHFVKGRGYDNLHLIDARGDCRYSVDPEPQCKTNLLDGPAKGSALGRLVGEVLDSGQFGFADFEQYDAEDGQPAAFIAQPVLDDHGDALGVVVLQISAETISGMVGEPGGMGAFGDVYLVGPDQRMRSDSHRYVDKHSVEASMAGTIERNGTDTQPTREALAGASGVGSTSGPQGRTALAAYAPLDVYGTRWALIAQIDECEALASIGPMVGNLQRGSRRAQTVLLMMAAMATLMIGPIAVLLARSIVVRINRITGVLVAAAEGDYSARIDGHTPDELGHLALVADRLLDTLAQSGQRPDPVAFGSQSFDESAQEEPLEV